MKLNELMYNTFLVIKKNCIVFYFKALNVDAPFENNHDNDEQIGMQVENEISF